MGLRQSIWYFITLLLFWPTVAWTRLKLYFNVFPNYRLWDRVHPHVLVGAAPVLSSEVTALIHKENVRCVVNLCKEWNGQRAAYKAAGVSVIHLPTIDHYTPTLQQCDEGVKAMSKFVNRNETVYVHCKAGKGRSVALVICFLVHALNMTPPEANQHIKSIRPRVSSKHQSEAVQAYWRLSQSRKGQPTHDTL